MLDKHSRERSQECVCQGVEGALKVSIVRLSIWVLADLNIFLSCCFGQGPQEVEMGPALGVEDNNRRDVDRDLEEHEDPDGVLLDARIRP